MTHKKIVFVIVEGPTDDESLGVMLERIFESYTVHVEIMHCDITTEHDPSGTKVISTVQKTIRGYAARYHYTLKDFDRVIHIIDTDGAFVPEENVVEDAGIKKVRYEKDRIVARNRAAIVQRNERKSANLGKLSGCPVILSGIPYSVYYMSCNLDHVLHDRQNSSNDDKTRNALRIARRYKDDAEGFVRFISGSDFSVTGDYGASWRFIAEGTNSLRRHTNLGIALVSGEAAEG